MLYVRVAYACENNNKRSDSVKFETFCQQLRFYFHLLIPNYVFIYITCYITKILVRRNEIPE
jgi:hypothetical protein